MHSEIIGDDLPTTSNSGHITQPPICCCVQLHCSYFHEAACVLLNIYSSLTFIITYKPTSCIYYYHFQSSCGCGQPPTTKPIGKDKTLICHTIHQTTKAFEFNNAFIRRFYVEIKKNVWCLFCPLLLLYKLHIHPVIVYNLIYIRMLLDWTRAMLYCHKFFFPLYFGNVTLPLKKKKNPSISTLTLPQLSTH